MQGYAAVSSTKDDRRSRRSGGRLAAIVAVLGLVAVSAALVSAARPAAATGATSGQLVGWGLDTLLGGTGDTAAVSPVAAPLGALSGKVVTQVSVNQHHACALDDTGAAYCWGLDVNGALGNGGAGEEDSAAPAPVVAGAIPAGRSLTQIVTGYDTSCALDNLGQAYCWGSSDGVGLLGDGTAGSQTPVAVAMGGIPGGSFSTIAMDMVTACGVAAGVAYCWGDGLSGQMGNGLQHFANPTPTPVDMSGVLSGKTLTKISTGTNHTCALDTVGHAYCWGAFETGTNELGNGPGGGSLVPVAVDTSGVLAGKTLNAISGRWGTCVLDTAGKAYCWGPGENGNGSTGSDVPVAVDTSGVLAGKTLTSIDERGDACVLDTVGRAYCWGNALGNGLVDSSPVPVSVDMSSVLAGHSLSQISTDGATVLAVVGPAPALPVMDVSGCTANEGSGCTFTVSLSVASASSLSVSYATADGTAVAPGRYTAKPSTVLTFSPGQTSKTVTVTTKSDGLQEPDQWFSLNLSGLSPGAILGTNAALGTVHDTSAAPLLIPTAGTVHRSAVSGTVQVDIPVGLANQFGTPKASGLTVSADWTTADWFSHAPADYSAASGTVTFAPGETSKVVSVQVPATAVASTQKVFLLLVSNVSHATLGGIGPGLGFGNIIDDNPSVVASIANQSLSVTHGSTNKTMKFNLTFVNASDQLTSVTYSTANGTGVAGVDYTTTTGTLLIGAGATTKQIWVNVNGAAAAGSTRTFTLTISTPSGPIVINPVAATATGTITIT